MALWDREGGDPKWSFVVDTDSYAGNFEREMSSYIVGQCDEYGDHRGGPYKKMYMKDFKGKDPFENLVEERVSDPGDDGIMRAPMDLAPTPGYESNGAGGTLYFASSCPKHPAYNSVAIFLSRRPTAKELTMLADRARRFAGATKIFGETLKVIGCRLVKETVLLESEDVVAPE